jgi:DNA replication initiation complex subunit (GINS family)
MLKTMVEQRGDVNYEDIMTLFRQENKSPQLTKVASTLYEDVSEYIKKVRKESEREIAMNPSSHASMMLNDQLKKAIERSKRVYELRQRKIALLALRRCAGDNPSTDNLTPDELVLFSSLTSVLGAHKDSNADFEDFGPKPTKQEPMVAVPEAHPKAVCEAKREAAAQDPDFGKLVLARVLEDVPTFAGVDREYRLKKEDVVSLPESIAKTLQSHGKIQLIGSA